MSAAVFAAVRVKGPGPGPGSPEAPQASKALPAPVLELKGRGSAREALRRLCPGGRIPRRKPAKASEEVPGAIAETQDQVEEVRGLEFRRPVAAEPVSRGALSAKLDAIVRHELPVAAIRRRGLAWETIGVIPEGTDLGEAQLELVGTQVLGFYVPTTGALFFLGTNEPSPLEHYILAHELTHALDDQHFDLDRLDALGAACRDEALAASTALIEGSAEYSATQILQRFFSASEQIELGSEAFAATEPTGDVPAFVVDQAVWPYLQGLAFVTVLHDDGGSDAVDAALRHPPESTEQVIHPEKYMEDEPQVVDVPDLGPRLGRGWADLDVQEAGEAWLSMLLDLRLPSAESGQAAAGWDGGIYRAWSRGDRVAIVLNTVWDAPGDATEFASAMRGWFEPGQAASASAAGNRALVFFASDRATLDALVRAGSVN